MFSCTFNGNLAADPEKRGGDNGPVTFRVAVKNKSPKRENGAVVTDDQGRPVYDPDWKNVTLWGNARTYAMNNLKKGNHVVVYCSRSEEIKFTRQNGDDGYRHEFHAYDVEKVVTSNGNGGGNYTQPTTPAGPPPTAPAKASADASAEDDVDTELQHLIDSDDEVPF